VLCLSRPGFEIDSNFRMLMTRISRGAWPPCRRKSVATPGEIMEALKRADIHRGTADSSGIRPANALLFYFFFTRLSGRRGRARRVQSTDDTESWATSGTSGACGAARAPSVGFKSRAKIDYGDALAVAARAGKRRTSKSESRFKS